MQRQSFLASNVYAGQHPKPQHWVPTPKRKTLHQLKNEHTPKNAKNNNLLKTGRLLNTKMSDKGAQFLHLASQGRRIDPLPFPSVTPLPRMKGLNEWFMCKMSSLPAEVAMDPQ